jgi:hypothetical protein
VSAKLVGVYPGKARASRARLFNALEEAFPVRFEARELDGLHDVDGIVTVGVAIGDDDRLSGAGPRLHALADESRDTRKSVPIELTATSLLPSLLAGQTISETSEPQPIALPGPDSEVLATCAGAPVWLASPGPRGTTHTAALAPLDLRPEEALVDRRASGRFLALLPIVRYLQELTNDEAYAPPPLRACFVLDDPNLHAPSYGFVDFRALGRDAEAHRYHVSMAMIPIDGWFAHGATVRVFQERTESLSISMHGNNHIGGELERAGPEADTRAMLAQAMRRVAGFEHRHDVRVCRVMAPPHGLCSEQTARQMVPLGFEGLSVSRPYPWYARRPMPWSARPPGESPLAGWRPADIVAGGIPVLLRLGLSPRPDGLALRAFLGQPLIICGHHDDLAGGTDGLAAVADEVNRLGDVRWTSLTSIARSNYSTRVDGATLRVRLFSRKVRVNVPSGIERIVVEVPVPPTAAALERVVCGGSSGSLDFGSSSAVSEPLTAEGSGPAEIALVRADAVDPGSIRPPAWRPHPVIRRLVTEGRDRLAPAVRRSALSQAQ